MELIKKKVRSLGQEELIKDLVILDKEHSYKMGMTEIGKSIVRLGNAMHLIIKEVNVNGYTEKSMEMNSLYDYLVQMIRECAVEDKEQRVQEKAKERGIIRFQKLARKKLIKFYMLVSSILKAKK